MHSLLLEVPGVVEYTEVCRITSEYLVLCVDLLMLVLIFPIGQGSTGQKQVRTETGLQSI